MNLYSWEKSMSIFQNDTYMQEKLNTLNEKLTVLRNNMFESDGEERVKYESEYSSLLSEYLKMIGEMRDKNAARRKSPEELRHFMEWLEENRNHRFDYEAFRAENPDLFEGGYSYIYLHGRGLNGDVLKDMNVSVEYVDTVEELRDTDLYYTPILIYITENPNT